MTLVALLRKLYFQLCINPVDCKTLRDHYHERPPVLKDHIFLVEGPHINVIEPVTKGTCVSFKTGSTVLETKERFSFPRST